MRRFTARCLLALILTSFLLLLLAGIAFVSDSDNVIRSMASAKLAHARLEDRLQFLDPVDDIPGDKGREGGDAIERIEGDSYEGPLRENLGVQQPPSLDEDLPNYDVHVFYYPWYGSPDFDGQYLHWNHRYLPDWHPTMREGRSRGATWPQGRHVPPDDIGASFYPRLGSYSSKDPAVLRDHMRQIRIAGAGVLAVSWYPPSLADDEGENVDSVMPLILSHAHQYQLKVCVHIEPYKGRNGSTLARDLAYIHAAYGGHSAWYRRPTAGGRALPLVYLYDSYLVSDAEWGSVLLPDQPGSVRGRAEDALVLALLVDRVHLTRAHAAGFNGVYTYFASDGFSHGSSWRHWGSLGAGARSLGLLWAPSVGPGYDDTAVRPWNGVNTRARDGGKYYGRSFAAAIASRADVVSITSFNEWGEGTQIEEAVPRLKKGEGGGAYGDYGPEGAEFYLRLTRRWSDVFRNSTSRWRLDGGNLR